MEYETCKHTDDSGQPCGSAVAKDRDFCPYHLRYRARLLRMAQHRARNQRFDLKLPPLESMYAVQSALTQLAEALAADMIDPKRADKLLAVLRLASRNLLKSDKWPASIAQSDQPGPAVDLAAEYGLPQDIDPSTPPELAFPEIPTDSRQPATGNFSELSPMPTAGYCSEHGDDCPDMVIRADHPVTPEAIEILEVAETYGSDAAARRGSQLSRNRQRRLQTSNRKRYAAIALEKNMRVAAERLTAIKLAERAAAATKKPPTPVADEPPSAQEDTKKTA